MNPRDGGNRPGARPVPRRGTDMADGICTVADCGKPQNCRGWCKGHYYRWQRYGDPLGSAPPRPPRTPRPRRTCTVPDCDRPVYGRGLCEPHYARQRRHGGLQDKRAQRTDPRERFERFVDRSSDCHLWLGGKTSSGYGSFNIGGRQYGAHVAALILAGVRIPDGWDVHHKCHTPACVRLDHLQPMTPEDNRREAVEFYRAQRSA